GELHRGGRGTYAASLGLRRPTIERSGGLRAWNPKGLKLLRRFARDASEDAVASFLVLRKRGDLGNFRRTSLGAARHRTVPLEDHPLVDHQARRHDVAEQSAGGANLHALARIDVASNFAANDDRRAADLRRDDRTLADNQGILRRDFSLHLSVHAHGALE